jgi:hypothetical protein
MNQESARGPTPYRIAEATKHPNIDQFTMQVVVPSGSTTQQLRQWHREIRQDYRHKARTLFINFYNGVYEVEKMTATDEGDGNLIFH